jgi:hypothetical protein
MLKDEPSEWTESSWRFGHALMSTRPEPFRGVGRYTEASQIQGLVLPCPAAITVSLRRLRRGGVIATMVRSFTCNDLESRLCNGRFGRKEQR